MEEFSLAWAAGKMRARITGRDSGEQAVSAICIDSRKAAAGGLFFALKGDHADGHSFVSAALSMGAAAVVASGRWENTSSAAAGSTVLEVEDPLQALGDLARGYRSRYSPTVIGITGSVGKTSTREMTAHILRTRYRTLSGEKNYNNEIGVPLTLFGLNRNHEAAVVEMGMRGPGEIRVLAKMAMPRIAVITNIGHAHEELLGSQLAIAEAKSEILEFLPEEGIAILPDDLPYPEVFRSKLPQGRRTITVGSVGADVSAEPYLGGGARNRFQVYLRETGQSADVTLSVPGEHQRGNAILAIAAAMAAGVPFLDAASALETWTGASGRMTVRAGLRNVTVLDDCYNAGPESMKAALDTLRTFEGRRVAVLGEMRELGTREAAMHEEVGRLAANSDLGLLITVGPLGRVIADSALRGMQSAANREPTTVVSFESTEECENSIGDLLNPDDIVLVKGSRAMRMERIVAQLVGEQVADHHG